MGNYESRRITISYFAVVEVCKITGLPLEVPSQALAGAVEKLIFQFGAGCCNDQTTTEPSKLQLGQVNKSAITAMLHNYQT
jgi:hypothetical protein